MKHILVIVLVFGIAFNLFSQKEAYNWVLKPNIILGIEDSLDLFTFNTYNGKPILYIDSLKLNYTETIDSVTRNINSISNKNGELQFFQYSNIVFDRKANQVTKFRGNLNSDFEYCTFYKPTFNDSILMFSSYNYLTGFSRINYYLNYYKTNNDYLIFSDTTNEPNIYYSERENLMLTEGRQGLWQLSYDYINNSVCNYFRNDTLIIKDSSNKYEPSNINDFYYGLNSGWENSNKIGFTKIGDKNYHLIYTYYFGVKIYKIDNENGEISLFTSFQIPESKSKDVEFQFPVLFEFSPDGKKLFIVLSVVSIQGDKYILQQYDISLTNSEDITNSSYIIDRMNQKDNSWRMTSMKLGPDGKIYFVKSIDNSNLIQIMQIKYPNSYGKDCESGVYLDSLKRYYYFPNILSGYSRMDKFINICEGEPLNLNDQKIEPVFKGTNYKWSLSSLKENNDSLFFLLNESLKEKSGIQYQFPVFDSAVKDMSGIYWLELTDSTGKIQVNKIDVRVYKKPRAILLIDGIPYNNDTLFICDKKTMYLSIEKDANYFSHYWLNNYDLNTDSVLIIWKEGVYKLFVENSIGCVDSLTLVVTEIAKPEVEIFPSVNINICTGDSVIVWTKLKEGEKVLWSTGETSSSITLTVEGQYSLTVTNSYDCEKNKTFNVKVGDKLDVSIFPENVVNLCNGEKVNLLANANGLGLSYLWSNGEESKNITVNSSGTFSVIVRSPYGCIGFDTIAVVVNPKPKIKLITDDYYSICEGDSILLTVQSDDNSKIFWNGIESGNEFLVRASGTYTAIAINEYGCSDSVKVEVEVKLRPGLKLLNENYYTICEPDSVLLEATTKDNSNIYWSTGYIGNQLIVKSSGIFTAYADNGNGCIDSAFVIVKLNQKPQPQIAGNPFLCEGETTALSTTEIYEEYLWNTGDTTKSITVSIPGNYSVEITDSNGCKGTASIEVKAITIALSGLKDIDFGRVGIGNDSEQTNTLTNNTNEAVTINRIYTKNGTNEFDITTNPALPLTFAENENIGIDINFEPENLQEYIDSLVIEITSPCEVNYISNISGIGTAKLFVSLPDLIYPVDTTICIPITGKLISNNNINIKTTYNTTISYESSAFYPNIAFQKVGNDIQVKLENQELCIGTTNKIIGEICGGVMLANQRTTDLLIKEFTTINPYLDIETQNGSLTIDGCVIDLSRIKIFEPFNIVMMPNPAREEITLQMKSPEAGSCRIIFYNSLGMELITSKQYLNAGMNEMKIVVNDLPSGVYFVAINDGNIFVKVMFIKE